MGNRYMTRLAAFVILERDDKILLARRCNTGYADGLYQMPSGHVEVDEYPVEAAVREAKEEVGVDIEIEDLEFVHVSHRINKEDDAGDYVDFFFKTSKWIGEPVIMEPTKCDELLWAPIDDLPDNIVPIIKRVIEDILASNRLSQIGRA